MICRAQLDALSQHGIGGMPPCETPVRSNPATTRAGPTTASGRCRCDVDVGRSGRRSPAGAEVAPTVLIVQAGGSPGLVAVTLATNSVGTPIAIPVTNGASPLFDAVTPDGTKAYVDISNNQMTGTGRPSGPLGVDLQGHRRGR